MKNNLEYKGYVVKEVDANNRVTYMAYCKIIKPIFWIIKRTKIVNLFDASWGYYLSEFGIFKAIFEDKKSAEKALEQAIEKYKKDLRSREVIEKEIIEI